MIERLGRKLRQPAVINGKDIGSTWGEVLFVSSVAVAVLLFAAWFVIGAGEPAAEENDASTDEQATIAESNDPEMDPEPAEPEDPNVYDTPLDRTIFENWLHTIVNRNRREASRPSTTVKEALRESGRINSEQMAENGTFYHNYYPTQGAPCHQVSQVVAKVYYGRELEDGTIILNESALARHVYDKLTQTKTTEEVILSPNHRYQGAGASRVQDDRTVYVTLNLC